MEYISSSLCCLIKYLWDMKLTVLKISQDSDIALTDELKRFQVVFHSICRHLLCHLLRQNYARWHIAFIYTVYINNSYIFNLFFLLWKNVYPPKIFSNWFELEDKHNGNKSLPFKTCITNRVQNQLFATPANISWKFNSNHIFTGCMLATQIIIIIISSSVSISIIVFFLFLCTWQVLILHYF